MIQSGRIALLRDPHCAAIEHRLNLLLDAPEMLALCEEWDLASINRLPLLMSILSGRYTANHLPSMVINPSFEKA